MDQRSRRRGGFSLVEVLITMTLLAIVMLAISKSFLFLNTQQVRIQDQAFAVQKAIQMMEELRGLIANDTIGVLDDYDDGAAYKNVLSTKLDVTDPADPVSGNASLRYKRRVSVLQIANEPLARRVYVRVYLANTSEPMAEIVSVLRTVTSQFYPSQVFDVYVLALENVPGWWSALSTMRPVFDNIMEDLRGRNPGLELRTHWITRLAYGRDPHYTPYINSATKTNLVASPWVYLYPGLMDKSGVDFEYYVADLIQGRINIDGTVANATEYSIADQYNHAVRYPDEESLYAQAVAAAQSAGLPTPEPSLRMLIEKMNSDPDSLQNILLVNLHGELLPLPPMRNYSDPAKNPTLNPDVRVVAHPEQLQVASGGETKIRVYPYVMRPDAAAAHDATLPSMTVVLKAAVNAVDISVRKVVGNQVTDYSWQDAVVATDYTLTLTTQTVITLVNSPLRHVKNGGTNRGLPTGERLYGLEYIPCEVGSPGQSAVFNEGVKDLTTNNPNVPKNTARWVITIASGALADGQYTMETRIGTDLTTGSSANQPTNLSRTYVWVGAAAPVTEQYQFVGDPRHMPYADVKAGHGYNWYFTSIGAGDYEGYSKSASGWNGSLNIDIPRLFQVFRTGLMATTGLWTNMTGYSFYYVGIGGEMGADASNGFTNSLQIIATPWNSASTAVQGVQEITSGSGSSTHNRPRLIAKTDNTWVSLPWIGELYPDSAYATWSADGNLPVGAGNYYRATYTTNFAASIPNFANFGYQPVKITGEKSCASIVNGNPTASGNTYFNHEYRDSDTAPITSTGTTVGGVFNFPLPTPINASRPFTLSYSGASRLPPEWNDTAYSGQRTQTSFLENYFEKSSGWSPSTDYDSSALMTVTLGTDRAYFIMNGLSPQANFGANQIGKFCVVNLLRGFMRAGAPANTVGNITQLPLVNISSPTITDEFTNPASIDVVWSTAWSRWDGNLYTEQYAAGFTSTATLTYNVKYTDDNGQSWYFVQNGASTESGVKATGFPFEAMTPLVWDVSTLPEGNYILRVEAYRDDVPLHYAQHQRQVYIKR
jgi:prepilin-type N-terminal cleavage/methylation domain-containing protein